MAEKTISINVDSSELDEAIEKANRLVELLKEADPKKPAPMTHAELRETLAKQFRILSERSSSKDVSVSALVQLTSAMVELYNQISRIHLGS